MLCHQQQQQHHDCCRRVDAVAKNNGSKLYLLVSEELNARTSVALAVTTGGIGYEAIVHRCSERATN